MTGTVLVEQRDEITLLTLDRAEQRNPLDKTTIAELRSILAGIDGGAVVITGAGSAFSAGGDLRGYMELYRDPDAFHAFLDDFEAVNALLETGPFVSVAMVNGVCVAGGLELVLSCDLVTAARSARIGDGHLRFGQLPGAGGSARLVGAIGPLRAKQWILTGELFTADEARDAAVVSYVFEDAELEEQTLRLARDVLQHSPLALRLAKQLIDAADTEFERDVVHRYATTSHDAYEGLEAFAERRPPEWRGA